MYVSRGDLQRMPKIVVTDRDGNQHEVEGRAGLKVMETLRELDYGVLAICGGLCSCATCHVLVSPDWIEKLPEAMRKSCSWNSRTTTQGAPG